MESLLQIIVLLAFARFSCRATFFQSIRGIGVFACLVGIISYLVYPLVIEQSGDFYLKLLADATLVGNIAVLITLEAIVGMLLSVGLLNTLFRKKEKTKLHFLKYLPEVLILGAILYAEQQMFYALPGYDFQLIAGGTAVFFAVIVGLLAFCIHWVLPDNGGRYELNFLINVCLLVVAIMLNAGLSSYNTGSYRSEVDWRSTLTFVVLMATFFLLGFIIYRLKMKRNKIKKY